MDRADLELQYLSALHEATRLKLIHWTLDKDNDRHLYVAVVDNRAIEIEYLNAVLVDGAIERLALQVRERDVLLTAAVGTPTYRAIQAILIQQKDWSPRVAASDEQYFLRAIKRVESFVLSKKNES